MNRLLIKQPLNIKVSKEECIEDLACLFHELKESYGMYDYFGEEKFETAFQNIIDHLDNETNFEFEKTIHNLKNELDFIKDGHFSLGDSEEACVEYDYAIRYSHYKGIPYIDCKKFYSDNESEREQLEIFAKKGLASNEIKGIISCGLAVQIPSLEKLFSEFGITSLKMKSRCSSQYRQIKIDMFSDMQVFINLKQAVIRSVEEACNMGIDDMPSLLADVYARTSADSAIPTAYRDEHYLKTLIMILAYKYCYGGGIV
jgi:hypothetical protein